MGTLRLS